MIAVPCPISPMAVRLHFWHGAIHLLFPGFMRFPSGFDASLDVGSIFFNCSPTTAGFFPPLTSEHGPGVEVLSCGNLLSPVPIPPRYARQCNFWRGRFTPLCFSVFFQLAFLSRSACPQFPTIFLSQFLCRAQISPLRPLPFSFNQR